MKPSKNLNRPVSAFLKIPMNTIHRCGLYYLKTFRSLTVRWGILEREEYILTEDRIFIPIIDELVEYFDIKEGRKEFFVRHDIITDFSTK